MVTKCSRCKNKLEKPRVKITRPPVCLKCRAERAKKMGKIRRKFALKTKKVV